MQENLKKDIFKSEQNNDGSLVHEFISLAEQTVAFANLANCQLRALAGPHLPFFKNLDEKNQIEILRSLKTYNEICAETLANGDSLTDSKSFVWQALKKLGLRFSSDMFNFIQQENVIEIYDMNNVQIFRNFNFFGFTSYALEDLLCRPWVELFHRANQEHINEMIATGSPLDF